MKGLALKKREGGGGNAVAADGGCESQRECGTPASSGAKHHRRSGIREGELNEQAGTSGGEERNEMGNRRVPLRRSPGEHRGEPRESGEVRRERETSITCRSWELLGKVWARKGEWERNGMVGKPGRVDQLGSPANDSSLTEKCREGPNGRARLAFYPRQRQQPWWTFSLLKQNLYALRLSLSLQLALGNDEKVYSLFLSTPSTLSRSFFLSRCTIHIQY